MFGGTKDMKASEGHNPQHFDIEYSSESHKIGKSKIGGRLLRGISQGRTLTPIENDH
jgi:hypothetical protein